MGRPTEQAKRAIAAMKLAGFARNEFSVSTEVKTRTRKGKRYSEYGDALVFVRADKTKQLELVDAVVAAGLSADIYILKDGKLGWPHFYEELKAQIYLRDFRIEESNIRILDSLNDLPHWREML